MMSAAPPAAVTSATAKAAPAAPAGAGPAIRPTEQVTDQQTGKVFRKLPEQWYDVASAWISAIYSLAVISYLALMVLYMLSGKYAFWPQAVTDMVADLLRGPISKVILYTAIGGAMGAAVNNLRSFISWHAEERAFGWRFIWKYLAMPPLGGTLAVLVYGILQGGMAVINGGSGPSNNQLTSLSAWATGTLAGYGSSKVFIWLDDKVNTLFKIDKKQVAMPDVTGKTLEEAKQMVSSAQLAVGTVSEQPTSSDQVGKVIAQTPDAGTQLDCGSRVDLKVGVATASGTMNPAIPLDSANATQNGNQVSSNGNPNVITNQAVTGESVSGTEAVPENGTGESETTAKSESDKAPAVEVKTTGTTGTTGSTATDSTASDSTASDSTASDSTASETTNTETTKTETKEA